MRNAAHILSYALFTGTLVGVITAPVSALEKSTQSDQATLSYNEKAVKKLLEDSDPDVAFLARLKMMQAHLHAVVLAVGRAHFIEAREHITHPASEILPDILNVLKKRDLKDPRPALNAIKDMLGRGTINEIETALHAASVEIAVLEASIDPAKMVINGIVADTAVLLLRTAVVEYADAFKYGKIAKIVEYHNGAAFVTEAVTLIRSAEQQWMAQNPAAYHKLDLSLRELQKAWPSEIPPTKSVIPLTKMLALVTIIELQINKIRAGA